MVSLRWKNDSACLGLLLGRVSCLMYAHPLPHMLPPKSYLQMSAPETLRLTAPSPRPMLGISGLLNLLTWVEHRQLAQASPHEEGGNPMSSLSPNTAPPHPIPARE